MQDYIDLDTKEKIRYISESSNASLISSGYSTMSPGPGGNTFGGNLSPSSSGFSMPPSPSQSPATAALQTEFSQLNLPSNTTLHSQQYTTMQNATIHFTTPTFNYGQQKNYDMQSMYSTVGGLTNSNITIKQEYTSKLIIKEHPVEKFRFRYKSEMHGTHGSLNGVNSKRVPKTFPEVELCGYHCPAIIRCSLFQTNLDSPHSHQLVVRRDDMDICDPHKLDVSPELGYVAQFQNMGIIHTAKKFIFEELLKKKIDRLAFNLGRSDLSSRQMMELHKETEREAKDMNLNQVRLCFEAFKLEDNGRYIPIAAPVYTNPINNRKSAQTGELRICRLSIASGNVTGGDDLILLVEKVSKKNIKVRFYELNEDEEIVWESFAKFRESDVHHQYAIVCQTPPYKNKNVEKPVEVNIELVRPSDDERSYPPVTFRYKPRDIIVSRKRRRTCSTASNSSASNASLSSIELPKTIPNGPSTIQSNHGMANTLSEEFDKSGEIQKLLNNYYYCEAINADSDYLAKICSSQNYIGEILDDFQTPAPIGGRIETDGASTTIFEKKQLVLKAISSSLNTNNVYIEKMFKIFDECRCNKNIKDNQKHDAAKYVEELFLQCAEKSDNGNSIVHQFIMNNYLKMGMRICDMINYFKLYHLLNRVLNLKNESALHYACLHDRAIFIRPLLGLKCDPNIQDEHGNTALHIAIIEQHHKCIETFINIDDNASLNLSLRNDEGVTVLHLAIRNNLIELVEKLLLNDKSAVNISNPKDGNKAIHMAVLQQNIEMVRIILSGQNVSDMIKSENGAGQTAVDLAKTLDQIEGKQLLQFLTSLPLDVDNLLSIKEEITSSSTEDEDNDEIIMTKDIKTENIDCDVAEETNNETILQNSKLNDNKLLNLLSNLTLFNDLVRLLSVNSAWKKFADLTDLKALIVLWNNAEDMLNYIKTNTELVNYDVFKRVITQVDKNALKILERG